jgi:methylglutamate dehydrogenase subunit D
LIPKGSGSVSETIVMNGPLQPGRHGAPAGPPGVTIQESVGLGMAIVAARRDRFSDLAEQVHAHFRCEITDASRVHGAGAPYFIGIGPGRWLVVAADPGFVDALAGKLQDAASVTDQSGGYRIVSVSGPCVRDALAKGVGLDLHPQAFKTGAAAATVVSHVPVMLWRHATADRFEFAVPRSFFGSFMTWLHSSGLEFGIEYLGAGH